MKAAMYSVHRFERQVFDNANREGMHEIAYIAAPLDATTVLLAEGCAAVIPSPQDAVDAATLQLLAERGVELIALRSAGYNNLDLAAAARLGLKSVYVPAYTPHAVAELVFALTLALIRHVPRAYQRTRDENFSVEGLVGTQLNGCTFGIVGLGKIGRVVAGIANGFGCRVIADDSHADPRRAPCLLVPLDELLAESHVVSLHAPLTPETRHLINAQRLAKMQPDAILVNTSRGPLIDTAALIEVLRRDALGGVALDVYERESGVFYSDRSEQGLTDDVLARLLTFPKVIVTSHMGFLTWQALGEIAATTLASLTEFEQGKNLSQELRLDGAGRLQEGRLV
jgi:D-lactate dehydrogenase